MKNPLDEHNRVEIAQKLLRLEHDLHEAKMASMVQSRILGELTTDMAGLVVLFRKVTSDDLAD